METDKPVSKVLNKGKSLAVRLFQSQGFNLIFLLGLSAYFTFAVIYGNTLNPSQLQNFIYGSVVFVILVTSGYIYFRTNHFGALISVITFLLVYIVGFVYAAANNYGVTNASTQYWIFTGLVSALVVLIFSTWFYAQYRFGNVPNQFKNNDSDLTWKQRLLKSLPWLKHGFTFLAIVGAFITIMLYGLYFTQGNEFASTAVQLALLVSVGFGAIYLGSRSIAKTNIKNGVEWLKKGILILISMTGLNLLSYEINQTFGIIVSILSGLLVVTASATSYEGMAEFKTWINLIYQSITYIPCLVIDKAVKLYADVKFTSRTTYMILLIEALLIGGYFGLPALLSGLRNRNSILILDKPVYTTYETDTMTHDELTKKISQTEHSQLLEDLEHLSEEGLQKAHIRVKNEMKLKHNYHFAISSYIYVDAQGANQSESATRYATLWNYGEKPLIEYNAKKQIFRIRTRVNDSIQTIYETGDTFYILDGKKVDLSKHKVEGALDGKQIELFPLQKWNHLVVNYNGGTMDIWLNGKLVATTHGVVSFEKHDRIIVGEKDGISGGVKHIRYYPYTLTPTDIWEISNI
jgi:uncharacterized membrane protein YqaE (UPF0057 family)